MTGRARDRLRALALVALVHAAALYLTLGTTGLPVAHDRQRRLTAFDVAPPPVVAREVHREARARTKAPAPPGAAGRRAERTPIVAPAPEITLPPPVPVVAATVAGIGDAPAGGTATTGAGTGSGTDGNGAGAGGAGTGSGGGVTRARLLRGAIRNRDYPKAERRAKVEGTVTVRFTVAIDGRARDCAVLRSSGNAALDATTCRLIVERFRYDPARDANGRAVAEERAWRQRWWMEDEPPAPTP